MKPAQEQQQTGLWGYKSVSGHRSGKEEALRQVIKMSHRITVQVVCLSFLEQRIQKPLVGVWRAFAIVLYCMATCSLFFCVCSGSQHWQFKFNCTCRKFSIHSSCHLWAPDIVLLIDFLPWSTYASQILFQNLDANADNRQTAAEFLSWIICPSSSKESLHRFSNSWSCWRWAVYL